MGRTLKRVPLDFKWPMRQIWKGYLNPFHSQPCNPCGGSGMNQETKELSDTWYTHSRTDSLEGWQYHLDQDDVQALIDADRLWDFTRVPRTPEQAEIVKKKIAGGGNSWLPEGNGYIPTAAEVNAWARRRIGHDAVNQHICVKARAQRLGVYGDCPFCNGDGEIWQTEEIKALHENWQSFEPPKGEGFQLWETTSEGSPISPVFDSIEKLCQWAADHASTFGGHRTTAEDWRRMLDDDFVYHKEGPNIFI